MQNENLLRGIVVQSHNMLQTKSLLAFVLIIECSALFLKMANYSAAVVKVVDAVHHLNVISQIVNPTNMTKLV